MRKKILGAGLMAFLFASQISAQNVDANGYTEVPASMGAQYANRLFFDFSENQLTSQPANNWDIAFRRDNRMDFGTRINDGKGIRVYAVSSNPADWDTITTATATSALQTSTHLYNPEDTENLLKGALEQTTINNACSSPAFTFSWGCYNLATHKIEGKVIFILRYNDGSMVKLLISEYHGGYTFKYAKSAAGATDWGTTVTKTIPNGTNDTYFNYFSFDTESVVDNNEPAKNLWDIQFTRYYVNFPGVGMYRLSGVLQSPRLAVAKKTETQATNTATMPDTAEFSKKITAIGDNWKSGGTSLVPNVVYYVKEEAPTLKYYRMYFTSVGGQSNGNMHFKYKDVTQQLLSTGETRNAKVNFGIFPNPAPNKEISIVFDVKGEQHKNGKIQIFDTAGRLVHETEISKKGGFFEKTLQLHHLPAGNYFVHFSLGDFKESKTLILK